MRLMIGVVSNRDHNPMFVASLIGLVRYLDGRGVGGKPCEAEVAIKQNASNLLQARNEIVAGALAQGCTHLLFIDDDMAFPSDMMDSLFSLDKPVVAANCCRKHPSKLIYTALGFDGKPVESYGRTGFERVARVGTGVLLLDLEYLRGKDIPFPLFHFPYLEDRGRHGGEDYYFSDIMNASGVPIYIEHGVSNKIGHIGAFTYRFACYHRGESAA